MLWCCDTGDGGMYVLTAPNRDKAIKILKSILNADPHLEGLTPVTKPYVFLYPSQCVIKINNP